MNTIGKKEKLEILEKARQWWREELVPAHKRNLLKLSSLDEYDINPFLWSYLAYFLEGNDTPETLAKVLIYPRVLGTSIVTTFGSRSQDFISRVFEGVLGSAIPGIDLEFTDKIDGRKKYCQVKAGPNIVNHDGAISIKNHFKSARMIAKTNHLPIEVGDFMLCLLYGESGQENAFIKNIGKEYSLATGQEFWHRFTGDPDFYSDLIKVIGEVAEEFNMKRTINKVIKELAEKIKEKYRK